MQHDTRPAAPRRRPRTPAPKIDKAEQQQQVEAAIAERDAMRARGEVPPLPDPLGRRRDDRLQRIVCGADIRRREADNTVTLEELEWMTIRREHLGEWQRGRRERIAARKARAAAAHNAPTEVTSSTASGVSVTWSSTPDLRRVDDEAWRGRLSGPDDLRRLVGKG